MGNFRFYRRVRILPGLSVNLSRSGPSFTVGVRGAHVTVGRTGVRRTFGIPGTGLFYTSHTGLHSGVHSRHVDTPITPAQQSRADTAGGCAAFVVVAVIVLVILGIIGAALNGGG